MSLDAFKNNAKVTVSLGYDNVATQIVLQAGDGNKLPAVPFNGMWWNSTTYSDPTDDPNKEIIRFTTQTNTDTFTIVRAQESTSAATHNTAGKVYKIVVGLTAKTLNTDIPATYAAYNATMTTTNDIVYVSGAGTITADNNLQWLGPSGNSAFLINGGTGNPRTSYNSQATIGVSSTAGALITDCTTSDLCIRVNAGSLFESVDLGVSARRIVRAFKSLTNNTATTVFSLTNANNTCAVAKLYWTAEAVNGTDCQMQYVETLLQIANHNGTTTAQQTQLSYNS